MGLDKNKNELKCIPETIIALIMLAYYFIADFVQDQQTIVAGVYVFMLVLCTYFVTRKQHFYETITTLLMAFAIGLFLKYSIADLSLPNYAEVIAAKNWGISNENLFSKVFATSYIYFYLIGVFLLIFLKIAPENYLTVQTKERIKILGIYSLYAIILHIYAARFGRYEILEKIIFTVFSIYAFWKAFDTVPKSTKLVSSIMTSTVFVLIFGILSMAYPAAYREISSGLQQMYSIGFVYSIGLLGLTGCCCIEPGMDNKLGFLFLGSNLLFFLAKKCGLLMSVEYFLVFYVSSMIVSFIYGKTDDDPDKILSNFKGYFVGFLFTAFLLKGEMLSAVVLLLSLLLVNIALNKAFKGEGVVYNVILAGIMPWILLELTMFLQGKLPVSMLTAIVVTFLFWCVNGVALFWKDSKKIKSVLFKETTGGSIIIRLIAIAYGLTALFVFI